MALRRKQKSRAQQAVDLAADYFKLRAAGKAAKGAKKAAKGTAVYKVASKTPVVRRIPVILAGVGAGAATLMAVKVLRGRGDNTQPA
jgi:hypothetical protein